MPLGASRLAFLAKSIVEAVGGTSIGSVNYSGTTDNYSNQSVNTSGAAAGLKTPSAITVVFVAKPTYNLERLNIMGISDLNNALRNNIFINTSGTIRFYNALASGTSDRTSTETLTNNDWNMVAISKDVNTGIISGWMNGSAITFPSETNTGTTFDFDGTATDIGIGTARAGDHDTYMWNGDVSWVGVWPTYRDFTESANQTAVWDSTNSRANWPGTDGTGYGWGTPIIFHYGDETTVATNQGNIASYTLTEGGSPTNGANYTATDVSRRESNIITVINDAQVDTAQSKFGGASALFDGTGDSLYIDTNPGDEFQFGTNDFTVECFVRVNDLSSYREICSGKAQSSSIQFQINTNGSIGAYRTNSGAGQAISGTGVISTGTWYHVAIVRNGNTKYVYVDGTEEASVDVTGIDEKFWDFIYIGSLYGAGGYMDGHIDEFRISDTARYTSSFTAPTAAFENDANTLLLIHADGADGLKAFTDDNS